MISSAVVSDEPDTARSAARPTLSVVVPAHNVRSWIGETIQSLRDQELSDLEVIVVDDHSIDGTRELLRGIADEDPRVVVVDAVETGGANARNAAVRHARGRYLAFCDADDLVPPGAYRALVESLEASSSDIAFGDFLKFSPMRTWRPTQGWPAYETGRRAVRVSEHPSILRGRAVWNKVFRADFWHRLEVEFPETARSNDIVPMLTTYLAAERIDVVPEIVYLYRERPGRSSMTARATSAASVLAYLRQEQVCATMITDTNDPALSSTFAGLFYEADGWKHLSDHLADPSRDSSCDREIAESVEAIMAQLPEFRFNRVTPLRRAVFDLVRRRQLDAASTLVQLVERRPQHHPSHLARWTFLLDRLRASGNMIAARDAVRMLTPLLADQIRTGDNADDAALVALLRSAEAASMDDPWHPLQRIPEFDGSSSLQDDELTARIRTSRAHAHRIANVRVRRGNLALSGASAAAGATLHFRVHSSSHRLPVRTSRLRTAEGATGWTVTVSRGSRLPVGVRLHLVAAEASNSAMVSFPHDVKLTAPYDRFATFTIGRTGEGGVWVERRPHWVLRGSRRAAQTLRDRLTASRYSSRRPVTSSKSAA